MLQTKFRGNWSAGSRDLRDVTQMPRTNFLSPYPRRPHIKVGFDRPRGLEEEV